jgi:hypothetical protein
MRSFAALVFITTAGCVTLGGSVANPCAESRNLLCATQPTCVLDRARSCMVCACQPWDPARKGEVERGGQSWRPDADPAAPQPPITPPSERAPQK